MRLTRTKRSHRVIFNLTPMIDIVFLLIIFFMTVSQITRVVDQPLPLPVVKRGAAPGPAASVTINIDQHGKIIVSGRKFSLARTVKILEDKISQLEDGASQLKIEIRCDRRCPSEHVNRIIERLSGIGVTYVSIAVAEDN